MAGAMRQTLLALLPVVGLLFPFAGCAQAQNEPVLAVSGYRVEGDNPLTPDETARALSSYTGASVSLDQLREAAAALEEAIRDRGFGFKRVVLPPQDAGTTITLRVLSFRLGDVKIAGNRHFDESNIRASLAALRTGDSPNLREIARNQAHANDHPAKQLAVTMREGRARDTVDADVKVEDGTPLQFFATLNNTGSGTTGRWRLGLGASHSNLFNRDHQLTATYSTSPGHWDDVRQYGAYYRAPFYTLGGTLSAYYTRSDTNSGRVAEFFEVSGSGEFMGLRWTQRFAPIGAWSHLAEIGVEDRFFDNNVAFNGTPIGVDVRSRPLLLRHEGRLDGADYQIGHALEFARNLSGGNGNSAAGYTGNRAGTTPAWQVWRFSMQGSKLVAGWIASARLRGQWSDDALIGGEQFGIGGSSLVRGLEEREGSGDQGVVASAELTTPALAEGLRALAFVDAGRARLIASGGAAGSSPHAASMGAGLRWQWQKQLSVSLDWARVFDAGGGLRRGDQRLHLSVALRI